MTNRPEYQPRNDGRCLSKFNRVCVSIMLAMMTMTLASGCGPSSAANSPASAQTDVKDSKSTASPARKLTRVFWQDRDTGLMRAGNLLYGNAEYSIQTLDIADFPDMDPEQVDLVQMAFAGGHLFVGVRDHADGTEMSGWIEIDSGVEEEDHGDHSHWHYKSNPKVCFAKLDTDQGNPAHVYEYGNCVYIANDKKSGFTMIQPSNSQQDSSTQSSSKFFVGGGGHITLGALKNRIAYSTWIDREGDNAGRVDVVDLTSEAAEPRYSFVLPFGGIHGAAVCGNRVFFAPSNGVCWVDADHDFVLDAETVEVNHLSLGDAEEESPFRTGAFESFRNHLICVANNKVDPPAVCIINATAPKPKVTRIPCTELGDGLRLSTVTAARVVGNKSRAYAFAEGGDSTEKLLIFELDPNGDRDFSDAMLQKTIDVGKSQLEGHFGHHGISFVGDGKSAILSNPGDGTLSILNLTDGEIVQTIEVGGQPTHVASYGGRP